MLSCSRAGASKTTKTGYKAVRGFDDRGFAALTHRLRVHFLRLEHSRSNPRKPGVASVVGRELRYVNISALSDRSCEGRECLHVSSPILLRQALRNSAWSLPVLWRLRSSPLRSGEQRLSDDLFQAAIVAPILQQLACSRHHPTRMTADSGERVLPIVLRILPGSTF
jgi:hypothetical protein